MIRTHEAGTLRGEHAGETVVLAGWVARRRDHGGVVFIDLRDASGTVQVVWRSDAEAAHDLRAEYCVTVTGVVRLRPATEFLAVAEQAARESPPRDAVRRGNDHSRPGKQPRYPRPPQSGPAG